jgi:hypothetical protein
MFQKLGNVRRDPARLVALFTAAEVNQGRCGSLPYMSVIHNFGATADLQGLVAYLGIMATILVAVAWASHRDRQKERQKKHALDGVIGRSVTRWKFPNDYEMPALVACGQWSLRRPYHRDVLVRAERRLRKFFNDFSRACARTCVRSAVDRPRAVRRATADGEGFPRLAKTLSTVYPPPSRSRPSAVPLDDGWNAYCGRRRRRSLPRRCPGGRGVGRRLPHTPAISGRGRSSLLMRPPRNFAATIYIQHEHLAICKKPR